MYSCVSPNFSVGIPVFLYNTQSVLGENCSEAELSRPPKLRRCKNRRRIHHSKAFTFSSSPLSGVVAFFCHFPLVADLCLLNIPEIPTPLGCYSLVRRDCIVHKSEKKYSAWLSALDGLITHPSRQRKGVLEGVCGLWSTAKPSQNRRKKMGDRSDQ